MADKRKGKRRVEKEDDKPCSKEEYSVAKHLRFNVPTREAKFIPLGTMVKTFVASKVVDALLESKWAKGGKSEIQFTDRRSCVTFCDKLLRKGLFHRAMKVDRPKSKKRRKLEEDTEEGKKEKKRKKEKVKEKEAEKEVEKEKEGDDKTTKKDEKKEDEKGEEKKKKERKLYVDMHEDQRFVDGEEIYVWIYDPVPAKTFIIGLLMVIGAAALCVFPLWPDQLRVGVYYCSLVGASFVGFILFLVVLRFVLFCVLWTVTLGSLHFWLLPNLTEDVGFFDSFRPLYKYDKSNSKEKEEKDDKKRKKREKREKEFEEERKAEEEDIQEQEFEMVRPEDVEEEDKTKENQNGADLDDEEEEEEYENDDEFDEDDGKDDDDDDDDDDTNDENKETKKKK